MKLFSFLQTKHLDLPKLDSCDLPHPSFANAGLQGPAVGQEEEEEEEEEEMHTLFVFTAEVIRVVRAGLDRKQNELGDVLETDSCPSERICKLMTCP